MDPPQVGMLLPSGSTDFGRRKTDPACLYVDVHDVSQQGARISSLEELPRGELLDFFRKEATEEAWRGCQAQVVWAREDPKQKTHMCGIAYLDPHPQRGLEDRLADSALPRPEDLDFLINSELFQALPRSAACRLFGCLVRHTLSEGDTLIRQGDPGDSLFLIQRGRCAVKVRKDDAEHHIATLGPGDLAGEMAVLTGEPRLASVEAITPTQVWSLCKQRFDNLAAQNPDLRSFLTELVTWRFDNSPIVADRTVGKYVIKNRLGSGGWSTVYLGVHTSLPLKVAVKMMKHDMAMEPSFMERFRQEARVIAQMNHPSLVRVFDIEELYKTVFIIMEHLEGHPLRQLLGTATLSTDRIVDILIQLCSGLEYAHSMDIIHRDIKPENVFILPGGGVKLLDFGLACAPGTEDMDIAGTPTYAPPEQILGDPVDARSDIYSLGLLAFEMATGQLPYAEKDLARLMDLHCEQDIPDPTTLRPDIPEELRRFILTCCARNPRQRYQNMKQAQAELRPLLTHEHATRQRTLHKQKRMTSLFLFYKEHRLLAVKQLLEEFANKAEEIGVKIRASDFSDV